MGYGPWQVGGLLLRESMITTVLGTLLGMPLGYLLTMTIATAYASDMFRLPIVASPGLWMKTMVLGRRIRTGWRNCRSGAINNMNWLDALQTQE